MAIETKTNPFTTLQRLTSSQPVGVGQEWASQNDGSDDWLVIGKGSVPVQTAFHVTSSEMWKRNDLSWEFYQNIETTDVDPGRYTRFGACARTAGKWTVTTDPGYTTSGTGRMWIYQYDTGSAQWEHSQTFSADDVKSALGLTVFSNFGDSLYVTEDTILCFGTAVPGGSSVAVLTQSADVWGVDQLITAPAELIAQPTYEGLFGGRFYQRKDTGAIKTDNYIFVNAMRHYYDSATGIPMSGSIYVYTASAGVWNLHQKITGSDADYSQVSSSLALGLSYGTKGIAAREEEDYLFWTDSMFPSEDTTADGVGPLESKNYEGRVFVYKNNAGTWELTQSITPPWRYPGPLNQADDPSYWQGEMMGLRMMDVSGNYMAVSAEKDVTSFLGVTSSVNTAFQLYRYRDLDEQWVYVSSFRNDERDGGSFINEHQPGVFAGPTFCLGYPKDPAADSGSQVVQIFNKNEMPHAEFTLDVSAGYSPLTVNFTNKSVGYSALKWHFDNTKTVSLGTSRKENPTYIYSLDDEKYFFFTASLTASTQYGGLSYAVMVGPQDIIQVREQEPQVTNLSASSYPLMQTASSHRTPAFGEQTFYINGTGDWLIKNWLVDPDDPLVNVTSAISPYTSSEIWKRDSDDVWTFHQYITGTQNTDALTTSYTRFGCAVGISDNWAVASDVYWQDSSGNRIGKVDLFKYNDTDDAWKHHQEITGAVVREMYPGPLEHFEMGWNVAITDDVMIANIRYSTGSLLASHPHALIFSRSVDDVWMLQQAVDSPSPSIYADPTPATTGSNSNKKIEFGIAGANKTGMRITDNFIYLFDPSEGQFPTLGRTGSASTNAISSSLCVYTQSSDVWGLHQILKPLNDAPEEYAGRPQPYFGFSSFGVSDSEDWLIFADGGIWAQDIPVANWFSFPLTSYNSLGRAFAYKNVSGTWTYDHPVYTPFVPPTDDTGFGEDFFAAANLGQSVLMSGNVALIQGTGIKKFLDTSYPNATIGAADHYLTYRNVNDTWTWTGNLALPRSGDNGGSYVSTTYVGGKLIHTDVDTDNIMSVFNSEYLPYSNFEVLGPTEGFEPLKVELRNKSNFNTSSFWEFDYFEVSGASATSNENFEVVSNVYNAGSTLIYSPALYVTSALGGISLSVLRNSIIVNSFENQWTEDCNVWTLPSQPPPPLFAGEKERDFVKQVNDELLERVVGQQIVYYPIDIDKSPFHPLYGEAIEKTFLPPVHVYVLVEWLGTTSTTTNYGIDKIAKVNLHFHHRRLTADQDLYVREGDFILYGDTYYEITDLVQPREMFGQYPSPVEIVATCVQARGGLFNAC